jgi:hypothetical protein
MADSYSLREVAEILGLSRRALQQRIEQGAFPGRFTAAGRSGLETRVPSEDVERELELRRRRGQSAWRRADEGGEEEAGSSSEAKGTITPTRELESLVPYRTPELVESSTGSGSGASGGALTQSDLESMRDAMLAIVREDREMFLSVVREALVARDREIVALKHDLTAMHRTLEGVRNGLEAIERRLLEKRGGDQTIDAQLWTDLLAAGPADASVDVESLLREISELEQLLGPVDRS